MFMEYLPITVHFTYNRSSRSQLSFIDLKFHMQLSYWFVYLFFILDKKLLPFPFSICLLLTGITVTGSAPPTCNHQPLTRSHNHPTPNPSQPTTNPIFFLPSCFSLSLKLSLSHLFLSPVTLNYRNHPLPEPKTPSSHSLLGLPPHAKYFSSFTPPPTTNKNQPTSPPNPISSIFQWRLEFF